jgi:hypothetical protein
MLLGSGVQAQSLADPVALQRELTASGGDCSGRRVALPVISDGVERRANGALYRMNFNQVTEGWNWHPEAVLANGDYYQYKFLPLASVEESRGKYRGEDKIGETQEFQVQWRYDYFFAFDNLYDFIPRQVDDDAGFATALAADVPAEHLGMVAEVVLRPPCISESTTFWKAIHARPVDFTLKKRYLLGDLEAVMFFDRRTQAVLGRIEKSALAGRR